MLDCCFYPEEAKRKKLTREEINLFVRKSEEYLRLAGYEPHTEEL